MKLAIVPLELWEQLNQQLKEYFSLPADNALRTYRGLAHATFEIVQGASQFLSHKRNLGIVRGQTPYFEPLLAGFYKEAFGVQSVSHQDLQAAGTLETWVQSLKKDTNFVLFAEDHPVTAEIYEWEKLDELLNEKKIFAIRISHFQHLYQFLPMRPYSVQICYVDQDLAVAKCGDRFKVPPMIAPFMSWDPEQTIHRIQKVQTSAQDPQAVQDFEAAFSDLAMPWFKTEPRERPEATATARAHRVFDRVVLSFKDISGEALLQALQERLQMDRSQYYQTLDTTNLCRWNHYRTFSAWWEPKPSEQDLEGLLVIDSGWLVTKDFAKILRQVCEEIKAQQSW